MSKRGHIASIAFTLLLVASGVWPQSIDPSQQKSTVNRALRIALYKGDLTAAERLTREGADVNDTMSSVRGYTPLAEAIMVNNGSFVRFLLAHGADVHLKDRSGYNALAYAADSKRAVPARLEMLLRAGARINDKVTGGLTPLMIAARRGNVRLVQFLINRGASLNSRSDTGDNVLRETIRSEATTKLVLALGVDVNLQNKWGATPLRWAAQSAEIRTIKLLLDHGARVDSREESGWTPLFWASLYGRAEVVSLLLARGAAVNARDNYGLTPLHEAAISGDTATVRILLRRGAKTAARSKGGETPLSLAREHGHHSLAEILLRRFR